MNNNPKTTILKPVFIPSVLFIILLVLFAIISPELANNVFNSTKNFVAEKFGWLYMLSVAIFVLFVLFLAISPFGKFKLGPDHSKPAYKNISWFAMLFSAGMGIGLMFFGVAEPVMQYVSPPVGSKESIESAKMAMNIVFFHWGIHAWSIYALVGLVLGYFSFRHGLPLSIRSALYPLIGEKIHGKVGHTVDTIAVLGTVFGVATSLGFGVLQVNSGLNYLFDIPVDIFTQVVLIAIITALATISVFLGLDGGIKRLSELNLYLASFLVLFVFIAGPTFFLLGAYVQNIGSYLSNIVNMTFNQYVYDQTSWMTSWTLFYWAWWIAWAPFVGMFIARVSRGRTIKQFVVGVLIAPTILSAIWFTLMGGSAIHLELFGMGGIAEATFNDVTTSVFATFAQYPLSGFLSSMAMIMVTIFFLTSANSATFVIGMFTSRGDLEPSSGLKIIWGVFEGFLAIALLMAGGLSAVQTVSFTVGLPFMILMLFMMYSFLKALRRDKEYLAEKSVLIEFEKEKVNL